jgi:hypothetical protein
VALDLADADVVVRLPGRFSVSGGVSTGNVARGQAGDNGRWGSSGALSWAKARHVSLTARTRAFGYDRTAADGYFSPRRFQLTELAAHWHRSRELGWQASLDLGAGTQRVRIRGDAAPSERSAWSASASAGIRWRPGVEAMISGVIANVASPGTLLGSAEYTYRSLSLTFRTLF